MRPPRTDLTLAEWIVLALIAEGPTHGWAITRELRPVGPVGVVWSCRPPRVYRAIDLLTQQGLVHATGPARGHGPSLTILEATPSGHAATVDWLVEPVAHVRDLRSELLVKLLLHERRALDASLLLERQRDLLAPIAAGLAEQSARATGGALVVAAWRSTVAQAALEFLRKIADGRNDEDAHPTRPRT